MLVCAMSTWLGKNPYFPDFHSLPGLELHLAKDELMRALEGSGESRPLCSECRCVS